LIFRPPFALVAIGLLAVVGVGWFVIAGPYSGDEGTRYVEAVVGAPSAVNPLLASLNEADSDLVELVFSGLTRLGPQGEIQPDLAESWQISSDGRTYVFRLRQDARWHDGAPFTADDVVFTYGLLASGSLPDDPSTAEFWRSVSCQKVDQRTLRCVLPAPFAPFLASTTIGLLPSHLLKDVPPEEMGSRSLNGAAVGTGPYRLVRLSETSAQLSRNSRYYLGRPGIERLELRFYADAQLAMAAVFRGEVMGMAVGPNVSREDLETLTALDRLRVLTANGTAYTALYLNNANSKFSDTRVRQAIAHAIDRKAIIDGLLEGRALRADSPIPPGTWANDVDIQTYDFDQGTARRLLDEAGWISEGGQVRAKDGVTLAFSLLTDLDPVRRAVAQEIARELAEIQVAVTVVPLGGTSLLESFLLPQRYETAIFGFDPGFDPDPYPAWHSSRSGGKGLNLAGYVSAQADDLMERARQESDQQRRRDLYLQFQERFAMDAPAFLLYYPLYSYVIDESVQDVRLGTLFGLSSRLAGIHEWTIDRNVPVG